MDRVLLDRFVPRLIQDGRARIARGRVILAAGSREQTAELESAFHRLGGEAGMLGLTAIAEAARRIELLAAAAAADPEASRACAAGLDELEHELAALE